MGYKAQFPKRTAGTGSGSVHHLVGVEQSHIEKSKAPSLWAKKDTERSPQPRDTMERLHSVEAIVDAKRDSHHTLWAVEDIALPALGQTFSTRNL